MTTIGILGTGRVGTNLGNALARAGRQITLGHRDSADAPATGADPGIRYATQTEAARAAEAAILFIPHVIRARGFRPFAVSIAH